MEGDDEELDEEGNPIVAAESSDDDTDLSKASDDQSNASDATSPESDD